MQDTKTAAAGQTSPDAAEIPLRAGRVRHASLYGWLDSEFGGWTLAETVDANQLPLLKAAARDQLAQYITDDGAVVFDAPAMFGMAHLAG